MGSREKTIFLNAKTKTKIKTKTKTECFTSSEWTHLKVWLLSITDEIIQSAAFKQDELTEQVFSLFYITQAHFISSV